MRAQMNLPALAVALLVVTTVTVVSLGMADRAYLSAERDADQRRVAVALSERLVAPDAAVTTRANVLEDDALADLNAPDSERCFPWPRATTCGSDSATGRSRPRATRPAGRRFGDSCWSRTGRKRR
ncbi:DUF7263 family protein [Halorussus caseinilyticus]|uniref:Uncharacterized protein n=1 Tax=Halorussus caseinilyticus TaxID=3034025 RepID=A0ABD5WQW4_9EURY